MLPKSVFTAGGKPFFPIGAQAHNSSGYSMEELENLWRACALMEVNSCAIAVSWERFEPSEGFFDTLLVEEIVKACRERDLKLILLWFGTWKNGHMKYVPQWVKRDTARFRRVATHDGYEIGNLSSFCRATLEADKRAFCRLMETVRDCDPAMETVLAVQVQNELGIVGRAVRDFGPEAQRLYEAPVPAEVVEGLKSASPAEDAVLAWKECGTKEAGSWFDLFGRYGDEALQAYSMARFVDEIAAAGKEIHPIPAYTNVWLDKQGMDIPGTGYPSGGPVSKNLFFWKTFAPHLDMICPDMYQQSRRDYHEHIRRYFRPDNPLYIPETGVGIPSALHLFPAIAEYGLTGVQFFGAESVIGPDGGLKPEALPMKEDFQCLSAVWPLILRERGTGNIQAVEEEEFSSEQRLFFDGVRVLIRFGPFARGGDYRHRGSGEPKRGRGLVIRTGEREFILCGAGFSAAFRSNPPLSCPRVPQQDFQMEYFMNYLTVEEGYVDETCSWNALRIRNGDDTDFGVYVFPDNGAVRVVLDSIDL